MQTPKLSILLSKKQYEFIKDYRIKHQLKNCSEVIQNAIYLLQQRELETFYKEASQEIDPDF